MHNDAIFLNVQAQLFYQPVIAYRDIDKAVILGIWPENVLLNEANSRWVSH